MGMNEMSEAMNFQRIDDENAIVAAVKLKQHCENHDCENCVFFATQHQPDDEIGCCVSKEPWGYSTESFIHKHNDRYNNDFDS